MKKKGIEKLFRLAYTDAMTGVLNRNAYEERLRKLRKPTANLKDIYIVSIKLSSLKEINKTYGRRTGDEAIRIVAELLKVCFDENTYIYRISGNEFICIAEKDIRAYIAELRDDIGFKWCDVPYNLDVSMGYASYNNSFDGIDALIKHCDKLMCEDKKRHR